MFVSKPRKVTLTLLCIAIVFAIASVSEANDFTLQRRDHSDVGRMIKKRAPQAGLLGGLVGVGDDPPDSSSTTQDTTAAKTASTAASSAATSSSTSTLSSSSASSTSSASASSASSSAATSSSAASSTSASSSGSSAASSASSSQSSSSSSASSTAVSTSSAPASDTTGAPAASSAGSQATGIITPGGVSYAAPDGTTKTILTSATPTPSNGSNLSSNTSTSHITRNTLIIIVVIASTVGAIALGWTLFRKWKLRPSSHFDDRMQPIDWQPTTAEDSGLPRHRREGSGASHGSFHSGNGHSDAAGYGATSDIGHGAPLNPIPDHDFTAGSSLAPVGGYADLQRGPSPQPQMGEVARGPSLTRPNYDNYGMPLHHQGGYDPYAYNGTGARY